MDWNSKQDRQALTRIVALLFAFAALADLAGSKPRPLRAAVLWLLRAAEAIGRDFVSAIAEDCGSRIVRPAQLSSLEEADDNIRLAHSFRALAELLGDLMRCGSAPLSSRRISRSRRTIRDLMLHLKNLVADHRAIAHSTLKPPWLDSS
jgi:hypothetical protein